MLNGLFETQVSLNVGNACKVLLHLVLFQNIEYKRGGPIGSGHVCYQNADAALTSP
jgi:hypothetical protein